MGQQIIKQPNGLYCIYNTIASGITYTDMTPADILKVWLEEAQQNLTLKLKGLVKKLEAGTAAYHQFTMTWEEALVNTAEAYGDEERDSIVKSLESPESAKECWDKGQLK